MRNHLANIILALFLLVGLFAAPAPVSAASDITVTTNLDEYTEASNGLCSLREAVIAANENRAVGGCPAGGTGMDRIYLPAYYEPYIISIVGIQEQGSRTGDLDILSSMEIRGAGPDVSVISVASGLGDRAFHLQSAGLVRFSSLRIQNGDSSGHGAGIFSFQSTLEVTGVHFYNNDASSSAGGGIYVDANSVATVKNAWFELNKANWGGGIFNDGALTVDSSLFSDNTGSSSGGGLDNNPQSGAYPSRVASVTNSTFAFNTSVLGGAGISNSNTSRLVLLNNTIAQNKGVGLRLVGVNSSVSVQNTIIANQLDLNVNCTFDPANTSSVSQGGNLETGNTCRFNGSGDQVNTDPLLGSLRNNGGLWMTMALADGSPALDKALASGCPVWDQRGLPRPIDGDNVVGAVCDVGAYEAGGTFIHVFLPVAYR